jgi:subtilisin-like proprotein convertase family protein
MHEFFIQRFGKTNSPALMKALLINGARPFNPDLYDLNVRTELNSQGWGMVNLTNALPGALATPPGDGSSSLFYYDQSPTNALVTGASHLYPVTVTPRGASSPLRVTLVWTDPPGNPIASIKLVNDLDLVVTNLDTGDVYFGNDIGKEATVNSPWDTNTVPNLDVVNNVESISLPGYAGTNLSVAVIGRRVNVNAVTAHPNDVAQDYALVISSGNGRATNALVVGTINSTFETLPLVTVVTNAFEGNPDYSGNVLYGQHAGAHTPLMGTNQLAAPMGDGRITLGMTNQWHFYAISNEFGFTNAAFMTFLPPNLAVPRMGATDTDVDNASRIEADVDMYVTTEPGLTNLDPAVIERSIKSLGRNGSETVILSNAAATVYYIGVKAEDQQAAEYAFAGIFSRFPFSEEDALGNQMVRGFPTPQAIPDAYLNVAGRIMPGYARILAFSMGPDLVRRVIVTNSMQHELIGDLTGTLTHGRDSATLNNHTTNTPAPGFFMTDGLGYNWPAYIYDDSDEMNVPFAHQSDGPGSLMNFGGKEGAGQWIFTQADGAVSHIGTNGPFMMFIEKQPDLEEGIEVFIEPGACRVDYVRVPAEATNLTVEVTLLAGTGPIGLEVCPLENRIGCKSITITNGIGGSVSIDFLDDPPLQEGVYSVRTCNLGSDQIKVRIVARIFRTTIIRQSLTTDSGPVNVNDDAISYAYITNLTNMRITSLDVGLLFNHPRISDMAITLISPNGTRVLLFEDRGALSTNGMGSITATTNGLGEVTYYYSSMRPFWTSDFDSLPIGLYSPMARFDGWTVLTNYASVLQDWGIPWRNNQYLSLEDSVVHVDLPTTNATQYELAFKATHTPYITGTVGWWPFEGDGRDIFGGFDGLLLGGGNTTNYTMFRPGRVNTAFYGDAVRTSVRVPAAPELNVASGKGFTVEGWIYPIPRSTNIVEAEAVPLEESFESVPLAVYFSPTNFGGWQLTSGSVDAIGNDYMSATAHTGSRMLDLNGWAPGRISTNLNLAVNQPYRLTFAYARNPDNVAGANPSARVSINGSALIALDPQTTNSWTDLKWTTTSRVFTVAIPSSTLTFEGLTPAGASGVLIDSISLQVDDPIPDAAPLVEWVEPSNNVAGLKFWLSGLSYAQPQPGSLVAAFGTNATQVITTGTNAPLVNRRWQHVALSYDTALRQAKVYVNGQEAASQFVSAGLDPVTSGDLFFGFHPGTATNVASFKGGIDEFGLYRRALSACEVSAIYNAGAGGKYGTNALTCPIAYELTLQTDITTVLTVTNGLAWTNGPVWELNSISFTNPILSAVPGGVGTNLTGLTIRPLTPNVALDEFVLSALTSNQISGSMQFTENTNNALVPIKFAPYPYTISNFPPTLVFSNGFLSATQGLYAAGSTVPGLVEEFGRDWLVRTGAVTVLSNSMINFESTNALVLGEGSLESTLPTKPGKRYELTWRLRGPGAVGWWNGDIEPLSGRALDLIGENHGAMINRATNSEQGFVMQPNEPDTALWFRAGPLIPTNPYPVVAYSPRIELSDPLNLRFTNALTIESWILPRDTQDEFQIGVGTAMQQIFYRGDGRDCLDPYYLAVYYHEGLQRYDIIFHVEDASGAGCGFDLFSTNQPVSPDQWQHVAAVFEANVPVEGGILGTNGLPPLTNKVSIYYNGDQIAWRYTSNAPFADLDSSYTPGVAIGNRSRYSRLGEAFTDAEPFIGLIDDLTVYGRALTEPEIRGIYDRSVLGKGDPTVAPSQSLAKAQVFVDNVQVDIANGENDRFTSRTAQFIASRTNAVIRLQGLLPGTIVDGFSLTEVPTELNYLPEEDLRALVGENAFGVWTLEMWDTRTGGALTNTSDLLQLVNWTLDFQLAPTNLPPVITLQHGVPYENVLLGNAVQHFIVPVPQWATNATNAVLWSTNRVTGQPAQVGVLWDGTNQAPDTLNNAMFWPPVNSGVRVLYTNQTVLPFIVPGQSYFLTITNPSSQPIAFSYGVWFDIETLTNCVPTPALANPAGVAKYFQFDVPTNSPAEPPHEVFLSLTGTQTNLALVVSQTLPLPTLERYDYISQRPSTNNQNIMVLTNNTPYPIRHGKWYAGVFNSQGTNVPFTIQVCYSTSQTNAPIIIPLTNNIPFVAEFDGPFAAPPGAPKWLFYELDVTNSHNAILFELYNLTGDADMIVQRHVPSGMAPYFDGSFKMGTQPESVVVRIGQELADLQGKWYVGVYNNESTNVGYTVRATYPDGVGMLNTALPLMLKITPAAGPHGIVLEWNSIPGEHYYIEYSPNVLPPTFTSFPIAQPIVATTTLTAVELPIGTSQKGFFRVRHESRLSMVPPLSIQMMSDGRLRISWSAAFPDMMVQTTGSIVGTPWVNANLPIVQEGAEFAVYYTMGPGQRFFRLVPQ